MSDLRKAAEMALEALEELRFANAPFLDKAMEALRQALAQPEQEPVAWRWKERINDEFDSDWILTTYNPPPYAIQQEPLYTTPPKREWVDLAKEDMPDGDNPMFDTNEFYAGMAWAATKLKEKNGG